MKWKLTHQFSWTHQRTEGARQTDTQNLGRHKARNRQDPTAAEATRAINWYEHLNGNYDSWLDPECGLAWERNYWRLSYWEGGHRVGFHHQESLKILTVKIQERDLLASGRGRLIFYEIQLEISPYQRTILKQKDFTYQNLISNWRSLTLLRRKKLFNWKNAWQITDQKYRTFKTLTFNHKIVAYLPPYHTKVL